MPLTNHAARFIVVEVPTIRHFAYDCEVESMLHWLSMVEEALAFTRMWMYRFPIENVFPYCSGKQEKDGDVEIGTLMSDGGTISDDSVKDVEVQFDNFMIDGGSISDDPMKDGDEFIGNLFYDGDSVKPGGKNALPSGMTASRKLVTP